MPPSRATALYTHINFELLTYLGRGPPDMDWSSEDLTRSWGAANRRSADDYTAKLEVLLNA